MTESTTYPSADHRRGRRLDRHGPRDVVVPHRSRGSDQLPLHRHGRRGPARHRCRSSPRDLEAQRHAAGHHEGQRELDRKRRPSPMPTDLTVDADLQFSVDIPGSRTVTGSLTGSGKTLELRVSDPFLFAGRARLGADPRTGPGAGRPRGCRSAWSSPSGPLVTLGAPRTSWLQRRVTGSRHIRIERGRGLWTLARGRTRSPSGGALPAADLAPPPTLSPIAPTMARRPPPPGDHDA